MTRLNFLAAGIRNAPCFDTPLTPELIANLRMPSMSVVRDLFRTCWNELEARNCSGPEIDLLRKRLSRVPPDVVAEKIKQLVPPQARHFIKRTLNWQTHAELASRSAMSTEAVALVTSLLATGEWSSLAEWLRDFATRAKDLCYVPNIGNAGDALIASGTWQLFDTIGLRPRVVSAALVPEGASVIYAGGGNLTPDYQNCARFLERCMFVGVKEAVVLPHTIRGHAKLLEQLDDRFMLVCRDRPSLEWCTTNARAAKTMFAHDLALRLDIQSLQRRCSGLAPVADLIIRTGRARRFHSYLRWRRYTQSVQPINGTLRVFRADVEAVSRHPGDRIQDIPGAYVSEFVDRVEHDFVARDLLDTVSRADVIVTNRLHVGIAGALLGKRVKFYDNSYGKIRDVYQSSLKDNALVSFEEE